MSENQQPLTDEQTKLQAESMPNIPEAEDTSLPAETDGQILTDAEEEVPEEDEDIDPADVRIFGLRRVCFHCTAFGVAGGYILTGLIGLAGFTAPNANICAVICGAIGYFIGKQLDKKRQAAREAAEETPDNAE